MSSSRRRPGTTLAKPKKRARGGKAKSRRIAGKCAFALCLLAAAWAAAGSWFVHHPRKWIDRKVDTWPRLVTAPLLLVGQPVGDFLDAAGLAGHDAVYEYDMEAPSGEVLFAGVPVRTGDPAPADIVVLDRGDFKIGWSPSLRHSVWVAYHVPREERYQCPKRPPFSKDGEAVHSPAPNSYHGSQMDRGHMAPNWAIATRFGPLAQKRTFMMTNIAPQSPSLNRGVWREVERRIADLWTSAYGEIWVIVGSIPSSKGERIGSTGIDIPEAYYQVIVAQQGLDVRALAVLYPQNVEWRAWPARGIVCIDELEEMTGLDFLPDLPDFIQTPLEAELPSRLWPVRLRDFLKLIKIHYEGD